jgi:hypothetical protein
MKGKYMSEPVVSAAPAANPPSESTAPATSKVESAPKELSDSELDELEAQESDSEDSSEIEDKKKVSKKEEKAIEKRLKKLKLKVDGKEEDFELDLDNDEELIKHLQLGKMGQKRASEKAQLEKELTAFIEALRGDPLSLLEQELGLNKEKIIEDYINNQIEAAKKTPEQLEREKMEKELQALRAERKREKEESERRELERLQQQEFERVDMQMEQALTKSDLPKSPFVVKKIADYMLVAIENGYDVTPEDVIPLVREEMHADLKEMFGALPEDVVEGLLGEQVINKLRKRRVAKAQEARKALPASKVNDTGTGKKEESNKPKEKVDYKKFFGV